MWDTGKEGLLEYKGKARKCENNKRKECDTTISPITNSYSLFTMYIFLLFKIYTFWSSEIKLISPYIVIELSNQEIIFGS